MSSVSHFRIFWRFAPVLAVLCLGSSSRAASVVGDKEPQRLPKSQYRSGDQILQGLASLSEAQKASVVKLDIDGTTVSLGAVVDKSGLVLTKASELHAGRMTAWLANGKEVAAKLLGVDVENDVGLVQVEGRGLKPVEWASGRVELGQWVVTQGIAPTPQAVGVVSTTPRKIRHPRALLGVRLARNGASTTIEGVMDGLGAEKAGIRAGDQILSVNGTSVREGPELVKFLRNFREGQVVTLGVRRDKKDMEVTVTLKRSEEEGDDRGDRIDRMGVEPSVRAEGFELAIQHDSVLQPWQCGGPLFDINGKAVGLNIARAGRVSTYALPSEVVRRVLDQLRARFAPRPTRR